MSSAASYQTTTLKSSDLLSLIANRRSYYALNSTSPIPASQIQEIVSKALLTVPSAFNTQTTRLVLALGPSHHQVWDTTTSLLRAQMGEERWSSAPTGKKIAGFRAAHGTVLFYEDTNIVKAKKAAIPNYAHMFDGWSEHTSGMHQLVLWAALEAEGFGANLQHYNGVIDEEMAKLFGVPEGWVLKAQLVFGGVADGKRPDEKEKMPVEERLKVFGA